MGRPHKFRRIQSEQQPKYRVYIPKDAKNEDELLTMYLSAEEFEALRLRHYDNNKQTDAAEQMEISQTTYSRILARAYEKLTKAFLDGYALAFQSPNLNLNLRSSEKRREGRRSGRRFQNRSANLPGTKTNRMILEHNNQVTFSGFGCLNCGYEWEGPSDSNDELKQDTAKKPNCPECNQPKTYRLIKKLTPGA